MDDDFAATMDNITNDINSTVIANQSELSKFSPALLTFAAVMTGFIMVIGLFGNILTVVALLKCPKVRNVAAAFIISLCIADSLFCAMVLPFAISGFWTRTWSHGEALCQLVPFLRYGNVGVSLLSIALITLNRYIMIAHHSWYARVYRKCNIALMIVFSWMFSYGMQIPTLIGIWGKFAYDPQLGTCSIVADDNGRSSKTALFVIAFLVPAMLILICYARIFWVVHSSEQRMREHQRSQSAGPGTLNNDKRSTVKDNRETKARRNEWRITKMVLAIFLSFLVCYLPITIAKVADSHVRYPVFHIAGYLLLYASACVNPIIYVIMNAQYRAAYAAALCCPLSMLSGLTSEMERASRVQLQQHTNGAQPSISGGVQSGPSGIHGPSRPWRKVDSSPSGPNTARTGSLHNIAPRNGSQNIGPKTQSQQNIGPKPQEISPIQQQSIGPKTSSLKAIGPKVGSLKAIGPKTGSLKTIGPKSGSQSVGPKIRFQIGSCTQECDRQTKV